ncbi:MAG: hypothetical protein KGL53_13440 [Elusimicrobia bacterium]|nr:hypothetical protein [Elusimicrobiota bacterium]
MLGALFLICLLCAPAGAKVVSHEQFLDLVRRGQLRYEVDPAKVDVLDGVQGPLGFKWNQTVKCRYEEKDPLHPIHGHTPKFYCVTPDGRRFKVKYKSPVSAEAYGEVAADHLLDALGFYAEHIYSVKIVCDNCPPDPWFAKADAPRATRTFWPSSIMVRLPGTEMSETKDEGFGLGELDLVNDQLGGSPRADVDAFKLLLVFMNHGDNTPNQQRVLCRPDDPGCRKPLLYITDAGAMFGGLDYVTSYPHWAMKKDLWLDRSQCVAAFRGSDPSFADPSISEAGRALLSRLLDRLTDEQIRDIFKGANFEDFDGREPPVVGPDGKARRVTLDDWVRLFKEKRAQVDAVRCPE